MRTTFRLAGSFLALAVLAAPAAGVCASLAASEDPCAMQATHEAASCGHEKMVMTGCCAAESVDPATAGILPGSAGDIDPPALAGPGLDAPERCGLEAAVLVCDGDLPPAVPRYRLYSALLL
ncbi:MAG: hypothetical protein OXP74_03930 [Acidobacteriota bacterium]|nr:hypothetical protein [Acidobacteriota bacterium]